MNLFLKHFRRKNIIFFVQQKWIGCKRCLYNAILTYKVSPTSFNKIEYYKTTEPFLEEPTFCNTFENIIKTSWPISQIQNPSCIDHKPNIITPIYLKRHKFWQAPFFKADYRHITGVTRMRVRPIYFY